MSHDELRRDVEALYWKYINCLDEGRLDEWPELFTAGGTYKLVPRENWDRKLPLAVMSLEGSGMLKDRVRAILETTTFPPHYIRHILGLMKIEGIDDQAVSVELNYLVLRTQKNELSEILNTGRYQDILVRSEGTLKFKQKLCIFDSELIPGSLIYPI